MAEGVSASQFVGVFPGVLAAGGTGLDLSGLILSYNKRVPIGSVQSFASPGAVAAFFGGGSIEATLANIYFAGYENALQQPGALLFAQYPWTSPVPAYLRGGSVAALTLAQLNALGTGTVIVTINGTLWTSRAINLSGATSFSNAATLIQAGLAANDASCTGSIAPATSSFTGVLASGVLTASSVTGPIVPGATVAGTGVTGTPTIVSQLTGSAGGAGTYQTSGVQSLSSVAMTSANAAAGVLTVASALVGAFAVGQVVAGAGGGGVTAGTTITAELSGTGGLGTYVVTPSQTVTSSTITAGAAVVAYDSVSGGFTITGGTPGPTSTIGYASGTLATGLNLTAATGAVTSQGAAIAVAGTFMGNLVDTTQNFATFMTAFEPVNADKEAFAAWNNSVNNGTEYAYVMWSTDILDTEVPNTGSAYAAITAAEYAGTALVYAPVNLSSAAAFVLGFGASLNFEAENGRATAAFKSQSGFPPDVVSTQVYTNLKTNGANCFVLVSTRNQANNSVFMANGTISGPFSWLDSFLDQEWLTDQLQVTLLAFLRTLPSVPYSAAGYTAIEQVVAGGPIDAALNFGAIRVGVPLSSTQIAYVNNAAGLNVAPVITEVGWYLLIQPASPTVRAARLTPPMTLFYCDGQSVQQLNLSSLEVA